MKQEGCMLEDTLTDAQKEKNKKRRISYVDVHKMQEIPARCDNYQKYNLIWNVAETLLTCHWQYKIRHVQADSHTGALAKFFYSTVQNVQCLRNESAMYMCGCTRVCPFYLQLG